MTLFGNLTMTSARQRFVTLATGHGILKTLSTCFAMIEDQHLRTFDRLYRVRTSGHIELSDTSFDVSRLNHATSYGPVNAWAFRRLLKRLNLATTLQFADLGCGLGRACILAAEYGFQKVVGVELAPELCVAARRNVAGCSLLDLKKSCIQIIQSDVLHYCDSAEDDVCFVYRAFSVPFFQTVCEKLSQRVRRRRRPLTLIYSERLGSPQSESLEVPVKSDRFRELSRSSTLGQLFVVFKSTP